MSQCIHTTHNNTPKPTPAENHKPATHSATLPYSIPLRLCFRLPEYTSPTIFNTWTSHLRCPIQTHRMGRPTTTAVRSLMRSIPLQLHDAPLFVGPLAQNALSMFGAKYRGRSIGVDEMAVYTGRGGLVRKSR